MENFVVGNLVFNGALVVLVGFFIRRWMGQVEGQIRDNRDERKSEFRDVKGAIDSLSAHVATANGRTAKLERNVEVQVALCKERNLGRRASDNCGGVERLADE